MAENELRLLTSNSRKQRLKELIDKGDEIRSRKEFEDSHVSMKMISDIINQNDEIIKCGDINERAQNTTEVVMDAQIIQMSHELLGEVMQDIGTSIFSDEEWINSIIAITFKNNVENWSELSDISCKACYTLRFPSTLLGSFDEALCQTSQKERQKRVRSTTEAEVRPENIEKLNKKEGSVTNLVYNNIKEIYLQTKQSVPYYKLIIDPTDFMKTVQNSFQIAFLIRDKSLFLHYDDNGCAFVRPLQKKEKEDCNKDTTQILCPLNQKLCCEMIKRYRIKESMLKYH